MQYYNYWFAKKVSLSVHTPKNTHPGIMATNCCECTCSCWAEMPQIPDQWCEPPRTNVPFHGITTSKIEQTSVNATDRSRAARRSTFCLLQPPTRAVQSASPCRDSKMAADQRTRPKYRHSDLPRTCGALEGPRKVCVSQAGAHTSWKQSNKCRLVTTVAVERTVACHWKGIHEQWSVQQQVRQLQDSKANGQAKRHESTQSPSAQHKAVVRTRCAPIIFCWSTHTRPFPPFACTSQSQLLLFQPLIAPCVDCRVVRT